MSKCRTIIIFNIYIRQPYFIQPNQFFFFNSCSSWKRTTPIVNMLTSKYQNSKLRCSVDFSDMRNINIKTSFMINLIKLKKKAFHQPPLTPKSWLESVKMLQTWALSSINEFLFWLNHFHWTLFLADRIYWIILVSIFFVFGDTSWSALKKILTKITIFYITQKKMFLS